jgi:hypothetical protein
MSSPECSIAYVGRLGAVALVAALGGSALVVSPSRAEPVALACSGSPVRSVTMSHGRADFGGDPHLNGVPRTAGRLCWGGGGAILEGQLYYDELLKKGCAHIVVEFQSDENTPKRISLFSQSVCSPGGLRQKTISTQASGSTTEPAKRVGRVVIQLFVSETSTGPRAQVGFRSFAN